MTTRGDHDADSGRGILSDLRVLECGQGIAAPLAAQLLAEAGAEVIKIEPPTGDPTRALPGFSVWNRSKRSVVLDLESSSGRGSFSDLLDGADVLVHDRTAADARALGWDADRIRAEHPALLLCGVPPYPDGHPDEDRPGDDSLVLARLGLMDEQPGHRPGPIYIRIPLASFCAAWLAAAGVAARLIGRDRRGVAGIAGTSLLQGALVPMTMHWARAERPSPAFEMGLPKDMPPTLFECRDGVWLHLMRPAESGKLMPRALAAMGEEEVRRLDESVRGSMLAPHFGANQKAFLLHDSATWLEDLWAADVPVQAAVPLGEIYFDAQAIENDYVVDVVDPELGKVRQPGHAYTTRPAPRIQGPAPKLGADTESLLASPRPLAPRRIGRRPAPVRTPARADEGDAPLTGVRVLDFGNFLAGPLAPMLLADLGADVIKVEATSGDMMRPTARVFDGCQRGKRGIALDLKSPDAAAILERLVRGTDVVHHNLRMPAATRLGLSYDDLRAIRPDLVYCHVSSYGPRGARRDWPGFDQLFQAQSGWEVEGAGEGNPPMWHRFGMMDHQCALASLYATLLGLRERDHTGEGQFVSASLLGASILTVSETVVLPDGKLAPFERLDAEQLGVSERHRLFECRDGFVCVNAPSAQAIAEALGAPATEGLPARFADGDVADATRALERAGVPCEPVRLDQQDAFLTDPTHRALGLSVRYPHATYGWTEQIGALWQTGETRLPIDRAAPALGQHSLEILDELGFTRSESNTFLEKGVVVST